MRGMNGESKGSWWFEIALGTALVIPGLCSAAGIPWFLISWALACLVFGLLLLSLGRGSVITAFLATFILAVLAAFVRRIFF